jgi:hypothetical protein
MFLFRYNLDVLLKPELGPDGSIAGKFSGRAPSDQSIRMASISQLKGAVKNGDPQALRTLFDLSGRKILAVYPFLPMGIENQDRLQLLFESAVEGDQSALSILSGAGNRGEQWALYGLERLADTGDLKAQFSLEQVSFNLKIAKASLWREEDYTLEIEAFIEKTGKMPEDDQLTLYLLPVELRIELEECYTECPKGPTGTVDYMQGFLDLINAACEGCDQIDRNLTSVLHRTIEKKLISYFECPTSFKMQDVLAEYVLDKQELFHWNSKTPLVVRCAEWRSRVGE